MTALSLGSRRDPLRPPEAPGMGRGFVFAIVAHAVLLAALSAGVHWRTETLPAFEAELWSAVPQAAAPREQAPPEPEPTPAPKPVVSPAPTPPQEDPQIQRDAEIAIAKARDQKKREAEVKRLAELETERRKQLALKDLKDKQERDKRADEKKQAQKQDDQQQAQLKQQQQADKLKQDKAAKDADAKREAQRQENLRRIQGMAGASGGPGATGTALQSSGPSATYGGRIKAKIRPNIIYNDTPVGNPVAEVEVRAAPDGTIIGRKLVKASGNAEWDNAVLRAIDKTEILPRDTDGRVPSLLVISFKPGE